MLLCVGNNFFGQLGLGGRRREETWTPSPFGCSEASFLDYSTVQDVQAGSQFTTVLKKDGTISICGTLNGIVFPILSPCEILDTQLKCIQLACGRKHILALMEGGYVLSWGIGYFGQLGHGDDSSWDNPNMIRTLEPNRLGMRVTQVVCGGSHSGAITDTGKVFMWGLNKSGQCGVASRVESVMEPRPIDNSETGPVRALSLVCGRNHSAMLTTDSQVYVWGASSFGRLGLNDTRKTQPIPVELPFFRNIQVHSLASGDFHMMALSHDCGVYSWGYGSEGQTGHSSFFNIRNPRRLECFDSLNIVSITCGSSYSMAVSRSGYLYAWGYGDDGWLGLAPPPVLPFIDSDNPGDNPIVSSAHSMSFDSRHNVCVPQRVKLLSQHVVEAVRCGGGHTVFFVRNRDGGEGKEALDRSDEDIEGLGDPFSLSTQSPEDLRSQLISWCRHKKVSYVLHALERGADIHTRDASGNTPLIVACQNGHYSLCQLLLERGADVNAANGKGNTSVHYSLAYDFADITAHLLAHGADDTAQNRNGHTPYELRLIHLGEL